MSDLNYSHSIESLQISLKGKNMEYEVRFPISIWDNFSKVNRGLSKNHPIYTNTLKQAIKEFNYFCDNGFIEVAVWRIKRNRETLILQSINQRSY